MTDLQHDVASPGRRARHRLRGDSATACRSSGRRTAPSWPAFMTSQRSAERSSLVVGGFVGRRALRHRTALAGPILALLVVERGVGGRVGFGVRSVFVVHGPTVPMMAVLRYTPGVDKPGARKVSRLRGRDAQRSFIPVPSCHRDMPAHEQAGFVSGTTLRITIVIASAAARISRNLLLGRCRIGVCPFVDCM